MRVVSIDKTAEGFAVKLSENAKVSPEKLMRFIAENEGANFSPNGILRVAATQENLIEAARQTLQEIGSKV